jgi:hypothetical protein
MTWTISLRPLACGVGLASVCWLSSTQSAQAFSAPQTFATKPELAGGGGRYFTGSPADGYSCRTCHWGGTEPALRVLGLPLGGYRPNTRYEVSIDWRRTGKAVAAMLEVNDPSGRRVGLLRVPPETELENAELCPAVRGGDPHSAATIVWVPPEGEQADYCGSDDTGEVPDDCRQIVSLSGCGAERLRVLWTTPAEGVGSVWFAGSAVSSNNDHEVGGDGVNDFQRVLPEGVVVASNALASNTHADCTAVPGRHGTVSYWALFALAACSRWRRLRSRSKSSR